MPTECDEVQVQITDNSDLDYERRQQKLQMQESQNQALDQQKLNNLKQTIIEKIPSIAPKQGKGLLQEQTEYLFQQNYDRDFLNLRGNASVRKLLEKKGIDDKISNAGCLLFSDYIYRISKNEQRQKRIIMISEKNVYILKSCTSLYKVHALHSLTKVFMSKSSVQLCALIFKNECDQLIEIFRRLDLNIFLLDVFKKLKLKQYQIEFAQEFQVQFAKHEGKVSTSQINQDKLLKYYESIYRDAKMIGFLELFRQTFWSMIKFSVPWEQYFIVLSNIGILVFSQPGDQQTKDFIPLGNSIIFMNSGNVDGRTYTLKITYPNSSKSYQFAAASQTDLKKWYQALEEIRAQSKDRIQLQPEQKLYHDLEDFKKLEDQGRKSEVVKRKSVVQ